MNLVTMVIAITIAIMMITLQYYGNFKEIHANIMWFWEKLVVKLN